MNKKKIIIADDDPAICECVTMLLEDAGYEVDSTTDGQSLLRNIPVPFPDLILLDIWMSGVDGRNVCRYLKRQEKTKNIPIVMISANKNTDKIAKLCGAEDFIEKPFDIQDLCTVVKRYTKS